MSELPSPPQAPAKQPGGVSWRALALTLCIGLGGGAAAGSLWRVAAPSAAAPAPAVGATLAHADFGTTAVSDDARAVAEHVVREGDHGGRAFAIVDKAEATLLIFEPNGRLSGASPILLGLAHGDDSVPGIGERPIPLISPKERTTPAGRFIAEAGQNTKGEQIVWVDYDAAVSMHAVRPLVAAERRLERLASPDPAERRISYGCINVPKEFFRTVAQPAFSSPGGVIYVLPETRPWRSLFENSVAAVPSNAPRADGERPPG